MKRISTRTFVIAGIAVALLLALFVSPYASSKPDGLEKVAIDKGIDIGVKDHAMAGSPLAGYSMAGVGNNKIGTGLAGIAGVTVTFALGIGLFSVVRVRREKPTLVADGDLT